MPHGYVICFHAKHECLTFSELESCRAIALRTEETLCRGIACLCSKCTSTLTRHSDGDSDPAQGLQSRSVGESIVLQMPAQARATAVRGKQHSEERGGVRETKY
ncbi:unnamed protein product [Pleuronectes platessa]|uniref:Uncharacterized protein n=1 Tax=Pleuronectes platessa TaxID=8262 RepID=A0A9N7VH94_PLEPL|nr:unnamed protein product [Pleuronectes platessa]